MAPSPRKIQPDAGDAVEIGLSLPEGGECVVLAQMPQEAEDQL